jgi:hypothetical protein
VVLADDGIGVIYTRRRFDVLRPARPVAASAQALGRVPSGVERAVTYREGCLHPGGVDAHTHRLLFLDRAHIGAQALLGRLLRQPRVQPLLLRQLRDEMAFSCVSL